jgi:hypothetical protein
MRTCAWWLMTVLLAGGCRKVPVAGVYCDGGPRWTCSDPAFPRCDVASQRCVAAGGGGDGGDDLGADLGGCHGAADCPSERPLCAGGSCRACAGSDDDAACAARAPATPRCFVASGRCAACAVAGGESADCAVAAPVCGGDGACRACAAHAECSSHLCRLDGTCAAPAAVAYADNRGGACSGSHAGTLADPACDVSAALAVHPTVRVLGSSAAYPPLAIAAGDVELVGPDTSPGARLTGDLSNPALSVGGATTRVLVDHLEISGGGAGTDGIYCSNGSPGPTLIVRRSFIHRVGGAGITANRCTLAVDRSQIGPLATGGAIVLTSSPYTVTNSFIAGNGSAGSFAVVINPGSTAVGAGLAHDTIAGNVGGGIQCNLATTIASSIVNGNGTMDTSGSCTLVGSTTMAPDFAGSGDWHLAGRTAANLACCIDRVPSSPVDHDFDGRARPQGAAWDVGAHEVP